MRVVLFFSLFVLLLTACNNDKSKTSNQEVDEVVVEAPEIPQDVKPVDTDWKIFWEKFKNGVMNDSKVYVMTLMNYPLRGTAWLSASGNPTGMTEEDMKNTYFRLIDESVKQQVSRLKAEDVDHFQVNLDNYEGSYAEELGLQPGSKIYNFTVSNVSSSGGKIIVNSYTKFFFGKTSNDGTYKLSWVETKE